MLNNIHLGDSLELMKKLDDESIDLIVSDVPYKIIAGGVRVVDIGDEPTGCLRKRDYSKTDPKGCLNRGKKVISDGTKCSDKWLKKDDEVSSAVKNGKMFKHNDIEFSEWLPDMYRVLKKGTHCYLMVNSRNLTTLQNEAEKVGFVFQNLLVWDKGNLTPNKYYMQGAEFVLLLSKRPHRPIHNMGTSNIVKIPNEVGKKEHPTQKPIKLYNIFIKNSSNKNDVVLDPFAGRGTIAMSCIQTDRQFIGFELDEDFYKICQENIKKTRGNVGLFEEVA